MTSPRAALEYDRWRKITARSRGVSASGSDRAELAIPKPRPGLPDSVAIIALRISV